MCGAGLRRVPVITATATKVASSVSTATMTKVWSAANTANLTKGGSSVNTATMTRVGWNIRRHAPAVGALDALSKAGLIPFALFGLGGFCYDEGRAALPGWPNGLIVGLREMPLVRWHSWVRTILRGVLIVYAMSEAAIDRIGLFKFVEGVEKASGQG